MKGNPLSLCTALRLEFKAQASLRTKTDSEMMPKFLSAPVSVTEVLVNIQPRDQGSDCTPAARGA